MREGEVLVGRSLPTLDDRRQAARDLVALGPRAAVVKGGHAADAEAIDIYWDGRDLVELAGRRINTKNTHGSGCVFSRSEEHTSELQSHLNLVCRLLLEKKKKTR